MRNRLCISLLCSLVNIAWTTSAYAVSSTIVISQVYPGAGEGGSKLHNKYIELFNRGTASVSIQGWSVQYAEGSGITWTAIALTGTIAAGQYYLIADGASSEDVTGVPRPDVSAFPKLDATSGRIALLDNSTLVTDICPAGSSVDFLGYGTTFCASGGVAASPDVATALIRRGGGCTDLDNNFVEFSALLPIPRNSVSPRNPCTASTNTTNFTIADRGALSLQSGGASSTVTTGYARVQPQSGSTSPSGLAIFSRRQSGTLTTEAGVPASRLTQSGVIYAAVNGPVNTGLAIANPSNQDVDLSFSISDSSNGGIRQNGVFTIPANGQLARFLNEWPFSVRPPVESTLSFSASAPVGVTALRGFTNERGDFLITTLPVIDPLTPSSTDPAYLPHFAAGGGWKSEILLVNTAARAATGKVEFWGPDGQAVSVRIGTETGSSFSYSIPPGTSQKITVPGLDPKLQTGSVKVTPTSGDPTPVPLVVFSYLLNGITVAQAGVTAVRGNTFRMYAELSGSPGKAGAIQTGVAIANLDAGSTTVELRLTGLDGTAIGSPTTVSVPASGQVAKFLNEIFPTLPLPFQGVLRISSTLQIAVTGLRGHYNENGDFLITTTPPVNEAAPASSAEVVFPHIVDSGGYTTQFILLSGAAGQTSAGTLRVFELGGQQIDLGLH